MKKIVVLASGEGSNFSAIVNNGIKVERVITNNPNANVIKRAKEAGVGSLLVKPDGTETREEYDFKIDYGIYHDIDLIVLAGWMRILSPWFCEKWKGKIINIHPSLLPKYKGLNTHERVIKNKEKFSGCTVHLVNNKLDSGKIILQKRIKILKKDNEISLAKKILKIEHQLYPRAIVKILSSR